MFLTRNIKDYISNKFIYCMKETYYKWEAQKLKSNLFSNTLYLTIYSALF